MEVSKKKAVRTEIENERKWLLRRIPRVEYQQEIEITQFYLNGWRYRQESDKLGKRYYKLKKVKVGKGINKEVNIQQITFRVFINAFNKLNEREPDARIIRKVRFVYKKGKFKFEVDSFDLLTLTILEVEGVTMDTKIKFPPNIEKEILMEVTGMEQFDNFNLAL